MVYSIIPNSYLARSLGNAFSYAEPITTCRVNKYYTNSVIIDEKLIDGLNLAASSLFFSSYDSLPQGLSLDPSLGSITGYPTCASETKTIEVKMDVKKGSSSYSFRTTVVISVVGSESSQTDYYLFSITPSLPSFLQFDASTGVIRGAALSPVPKTRFVIHGQTTTSVVNKELALEFVKGVNGTAAGGEVQCDHGSIKVVKKWG